MIKKLVAFGDSFTLGSDFDDCNPYSMKTWGSLTAKHFNLDYDCIAEGGRSNDSISRNCIEYCDSITDVNNILVAIMWTYPIRHEVFLQKLMKLDNKITNYYCISTWHSLSFQERIHTFNLVNENIDHWKEKYKQESINGVIDIARAYNNNIAYHHWVSLSLQAQLFTMNYLKLKGIKYIFTYSTKEGITPDLRIKTKYIDILQKSILQGNVVCSNGLVDIAESNKFKTGETNHPLDESHKYFTEELVLPYITSNIPF